MLRHPPTTRTNPLHGDAAVEFKEMQEFDTSGVALRGGGFMLKVFDPRRPRS